MKKNWLARVAARWYRSQRVVPDVAFQGADEPYPRHWRRFPQPWPPSWHIPRARVIAALDELPGTWRAVLLRHDGTQRASTGRASVDATVAAGLGLTVDQERDILARARAAVRDRLDLEHEGPTQ